MTHHRRSHPLDLAVERVAPGVRIPPELIEVILTRGSAAQLLSLASSCHLSRDQRQVLLERGDSDLDLALGGRSDLTGDEFATLRERADHDLVAVLATSPSCPYAARPALVAAYLSATSPLPGAHPGLAHDRQRAITRLLQRDVGLRRCVAASSGWLAVLSVLEVDQLTSDELAETVTELVEAADGAVIGGAGAVLDRLLDAVRRDVHLDVTFGATFGRWLGRDARASEVQLAPLSALEARQLRRWPCDPGSAALLPWRDLIADGSPAWQSLVLQVLFDHLGDDLEAWAAASALSDDLDDSQPAKQLLATIKLLTPARTETASTSLPRS